MMNRMLFLLLSSLALVFASGLTVQAKPVAPVELDYSVPKNMAPGTQVTTLITFIATADLQQLTVSARAYKGLVLLSGGDPLVFSDLKRGDRREMEVSIQLADEVGYLSVFATTTDSRAKTQARSMAIKYGQVGEATKQKTRPQGLIENPAGEKLILMPAEPR